LRRRSTATIQATATNALLSRAVFTGVALAGLKNQSGCHSPNALWRYCNRAAKIVQTSTYQLSICGGSGQLRQIEFRPKAAHSLWQFSQGCR